MAKYAEEILLIVGGACIVYGLALVFAPLAWIGAGAGLIAFAILVGKANAAQ